ncbi:serine hydrolase domain-containing protein [Longirhabdus pacifica]|uniref:serine hydrolase domain-containing protein n=1 Tax=Longirhabdus pacifica TaxID=2305227 RepID=UPI001008E02C|nr:serine hydrolase [Longirhabdus pacifica]
MDKLAIEKVIGEEYSGVISVKQAGKMVFEKAYGFADMRNRRVNHLDTRFQTASGCKIFAAVAILQLIEKKRLSFDSTLKEVVDFELNEMEPSVTVRQLLNHTSGVPDYFDETIMTEYEELWSDFPMYNIRSLKDLLPLFINKPMMYKCGEKFQYNNTGYVLLGMIVENITGVSFDQYVQHNIFDKANMKQSGYFELDRLPENCADAYIFDEHTTSYRTNIYSVDVKGGSAGGAFVSSRDMHNFWEPLLHHTLLSEELTNSMLSVQAKDDSTMYGYGVWMDVDKDGEEYYFVQGSDPGVSFYSALDIKRKVSITLMSNMHHDVWKYSNNIMDVLKLESSR